MRMNSNDLFGLSDRVAVVTGAASGYGLASAQILSKYGASIVACDIDTANLAAIVARLPEPSRHTFHALDVSRVSESQNLVDAVLAKYQRLDILVNAAAVLQSVDIEQVDEPHWNRTIDVNLKGAYFLSRATSMPMRRQKWGRIINFISTASFTGGARGSSVYGISKAGVVAMTRGFARALGRDNVLVNAISPASLRTPLFRRGMSDQQLEEVSREYLKSSLFGRWTEPEEVARSVLYLASEMSSCVTGHLLRADSGAEVVHP
jgi:NAD(P)-dependent dehydrogenase (short-subunit alcohol dehydrogenase family)